MTESKLDSASENAHHALLLISSAGTGELLAGQKPMVLGDAMLPDVQMALSKLDVVGRRCTPSERMAAVPAYRKVPWIDGDVANGPSEPGFYTVEPLVVLADVVSVVHPLLAAERQRAEQMAADVSDLERQVCDQRQSLVEAKKMLELVVEELAAIHDVVGSGRPVAGMLNHNNLAMARTILKATVTD